MYKVVNYVDCTREQQQEILTLRNMDDVRKWMVNPDVIDEESHFRFVESLRGNKDRLYFAIFEDGVLVGTYNLTKEQNGIWERGIIANQQAQSKGKTKDWEEQIIAELPQYGIKLLTAKVKIDNPRSIRYHEKVGYQEIQRDNEYIYYKIDTSLIQKSARWG